MGKKEALDQIAEWEVPDSLDLWQGIQSRATRARAGSSGRRRLLVGLAASAIVALVIGGTFSLWNQAEPANAEVILDRAQSTVDGAAGVKSYHLQMTRQVSAKGNQTITSEIWFGGSDRQRTVDQAVDSGGGTVSRSEVVFNGAQTWIANTEGGQTRVVHTVGTIWNKPADDPSQLSSLSDVLARYSNNKGCMTAEAQGEAVVAGRAAFLIKVTPKPGGCGVQPDPTAQAKVGAQSSGVKSLVVGQMLLWVDKQSYLPLKTEVRDLSGAVIDRSEVTAVEYNVTIPDSVFSYTPPTGATVSEFTGGTGADVKRALYGVPTSKPQPNKKP